MSCGGSHLGFRIGIKNPNFLEDLQMIIPGQFGFNCPSGLREAFWQPLIIYLSIILPISTKRTIAFHLNSLNLKNIQMPSSQKLQIWLKPNCTWMFLGWFSTNFSFFCSDMKFKMATTAGLSLTLDPMGKMFQNASSLKPLRQLKPNCP